MAFTLTGELPNVIAGQAYSATLALGGTFTAPVAIDASVGAIPSWMTPTVSGSTVTFSGTAPAGAEADSFTVRATDSSGTPQVATSPQSVSVVALGAWTAETVPGSGTWYGLAYGNGAFVGVASNLALAARSVDGVTWTNVTLPSGALCRGIAYGGGLFVALGYGNTHAYTSPDGLTWTTRALPGASAKNWFAIAYGNGLFVAVVNGTSDVATSPDGITWTLRALPSSQSWNSVAYGNGLFVVVASGGNAATSPDGITWTPCTLPIGAGAPAVGYGNEQFLVVAYNSNVAATSPDGVNWTARTLPVASTWRSVAFGEGAFVVVSNATASLASCDGVNFETLTLPSSVSWQGLAYGGGLFAAVADRSAGGAAIMSVTGPSNPMTLVGTLPNVAVGADYNATLQLDGDFVAPVTIDASVGAIPAWMTATVSGSTVTFAGTAPAAGEVDSFTVRATDSSSTPQVATSQQSVTVTDVAEWTVNSAALPFSDQWIGAAYGNDLYMLVALGSAFWARSTDGVTWTQGNMPVSALWEGVAFGAGLFVAYANNSAVAYTSPDGITWTQRALPASAAWDAMTFGNGRFVAVSTASSAAAAVSTDGMTWSAGTLPKASNWHSVAFGNGVFVAVAGGGSDAATSPDGVTWTLRALPSSQSWQGVAYGDGLFVAIVGAATSVYATSPDGVTWTQRALPISATWTRILCSQDLFVLVASDSDVSLVSYDGLTWTPVALTNLPWQALGYGNGLFVTADSTGATVATLPVTVLPVAMSLSGTLPNAVAGEAYEGTLTLGGDFTAPVAIDASVGSIPSWMTPTVSGNTVTFPGTAPANAETDSFTVRATDSSGTPQVATSAQTVSVVLDPMTLTGSLPDALAGAAYNASLTLGGDFTAPVTIGASAGSIPAWLTPTVSGNTVTFAGTAPAHAETSSFEIRATDSSATPRSASLAQTLSVLSATACFWDLATRNAASDCAAPAALFNFKTANLYDAEDSSHQDATQVSSQDQNVADAAGDLGRVELVLGPGVEWGGDLVGGANQPTVSFDFPCRINGGDFTDPVTGITYHRAVENMVVAFQLFWSNGDYLWDPGQNTAMLPVLEIFAGGVSLGTWLCSRLQAQCKNLNPPPDYFPAEFAAGFVAGNPMRAMRFLFNINGDEATIDNETCDQGPSIALLPDAEDCIARLTLKQGVFSCAASATGDVSTYTMKLTKVVMKANAAMYPNIQSGWAAGWE